MSAPSDIGPDTVLARSGDMLEASIGAEKVMMSIERGEYYGLDAIGSEIWSMFDRPRSVADVCTELVRRYEVAPEVCERDVIAFLGDLIADGSLCRVDPASS